MAVHVVGSVNADVTLPVERLPAPGATILAGDLVRSGGGKGANAAVAAARDAAGVHLVAAVGDDQEGRQSVAELRREGVDVSSVVVAPDAPTGLAMICVDDAGENLIVVAPGANAGLTGAVVADGLAELTAGDVCVVSFEIPDEAIHTAARFAGERGAALILNPSPVRDLTLPGGAMLVANGDEVAQLGGADELLRRGCHAVVATHGAEGVRLATADGHHFDVPAYPATPVDTTGAGDTFTGVLAAGLARGSSLRDAVRRGAAAAALATEGIGARAAMPTRPAVDRHLARGGP